MSIFTSSESFLVKQQKIVTQYFVNSARVQVRLPQDGEMWFFIEPETTVSQFKKSCRDEDSLVSDIEIRDDQGQVSEQSSLFEHLGLQKPLYLRLNDITYTFDTLQRSENGLHLKETTDSNYKKCLDLGLSNLNANTVSTMINNISKNLKDDQKYTPEQVHQMFVEQAGFFENAVLRDQIYKLYALRLSVQAELEQLEQRYEEIQALEDRKNKRVFAAMTCWFTFQFGISYYSIFMVPWLGWDLVEPVTYSVSQGSAILGLFYMYRNRGMGIEYTELNEYWFQKRQKQWLTRYGFDLQRLKFIRQKSKSIQQEIKKTELQRFD